MRRSAAALLARSPAPPPTPPPEGLEAVRAAAAAAMQAVDAKLAAVRSAVSGGRAAAPVVLPPGSGAVQGMRRSGSEPELLGRALGRASAALPAAEPGVREPWQHVRRSSCPSLIVASAGPFITGLQGADSSPRSRPPAGLGWPSPRRGPGGGGGCRHVRGSAAGAVDQGVRGPWRQLPPAVRSAWPRPPCVAAQPSAFGTEPLPTAAASVQQPAWKERWLLSAASTLCPSPCGGGGADCRGVRGRELSRVCDDGAGRLSPLLPGPMLAGRSRP